METHLQLDLIAERLHVIDLKLDAMCADLKCDLREFRAFVQERLEASRRCGG
ncbi:MAG: hypothetical protein WAP47_01235 [Candidatus Rokuibacteriota bacterium]